MLHVWCRLQVLNLRTTGIGYAGHWEASVEQGLPFCLAFHCLFTYSTIHQIFIKHLVRHCSGCWEHKLGETQTDLVLSCVDCLSPLSACRFLLSSHSLPLEAQLPLLLYMLNLCLSSYLLFVLQRPSAVSLPPLDSELLNDRNCVQVVLCLLCWLAPGSALGTPLLPEEMKRLHWNEDLNLPWMSD